MTKLLLRLFVKDHKNLESATAHASVGRLASIAGIVCNTVLFAIKLLAGLLSGSVSIIADALNNLSDSASSVVTLLGFHMAQRPADQDHPYGHARYEYISGLIVAGLILLIGAELVKSSVRKIFNPVSVDFSTVTLIILLVSIGIKFWLQSFYSYLGKKINSTTLKAAGIDSRNDVIATVAVLAACVIEWRFHINIDGYAGLAVALFILYSGIGVVRETASPLLGQQADRKLTERIGDIILSHERVLGVHDLLVHDYGPGKCFASVHVELSANEDPIACHDLIDAIESRILEELNVNMVIHYDPVAQNDEEWEHMRSVVESVIGKIHPQISMHDFRVVRSDAQPKLMFDLTVPYSLNDRQAQIKEQIQCALHAQNISYMIVIRFDN